MADKNDNGKKPGGKDAVRNMIDAARNDLGAYLDDADANFTAMLGVGDPEPGGSLDNIKPGQWVPDELGLPGNCPVIPLGVDGDVYFFLDTIGQLREFAANSFSQKTLNSLFMGRHRFLYWAWPRLKKLESGSFEVTGWRAELATEDLMLACARKGPWNAIDAMRGRGAWRGPDGELIVHCGKALIAKGRRLGLGESGGAVYATRPPVGMPWGRPLDPEADGPAVPILTLLRTWNWKRPEIDPILMIGWMAAALIGGALAWRPIVYMTGDKATGKSTLQALLKHVLGKWLIQSGDTTAAGVYQQLHFDALPVAIDELEAKDDNRKAKALIELARLASSGALMFRGGESHTGVQFNARSCFLFSSINAPALDPQDLSRMALLQLRRLEANGVTPVIDPEALARAGRMLLRRLIDNWDTFPQLLKNYRKVLAGAGHDGRGQDTFGTLLACAELAIGTDAETLDVKMGTNTETLDWWGAQMPASRMTEYEDAGENWRKCLDLLLTKKVENWKHNTFKTVGQLLDKYWLHIGGEHGQDLGWAKTVDFLNEAGLTMQVDRETQETFLVVPNNHTSLYDLFRGSKWQGTPDAGVWKDALRQAPQAMYREGSCRIHGSYSRATLFPLSKIIIKEETADGQAETEPAGA